MVSDPISMTFPALGEKTHPVYYREMLHYEELFPNINVAQELCAMKAWLEANPAKRKKNTRRFIVNWLIRATQRTSIPSAIQAEARVGRCAR